MKIALAAEKIKLGIAEQETNKMLASLQKWFPLAIYSKSKDLWGPEINANRMQEN